MISRRLGIVFIALALMISVALVFIISSLQGEAEALGCFEDAACATVDTSLSITHLIFGLVGFIFALGVYLLFFYTAEDALLRRLDEDKRKLTSEEKYQIIRSVLDKYEAEVLDLVREDNGIMQSTLVLRSDMSKSKMTEVLNSLEDKNLVVRQKKGKSNRVFMKNTI